MTPKSEHSVRVADVAPHTGMNRRKLLVAGAWATPAVALIAATPAYAASPNHSVLTVRAGSSFTRWEGTGPKAPGFRFSNTSGAAIVATITFSQVGAGTVSVATLFNVYNALVVSEPTHVGSTYTFTVPIPSGSGTKGITLKETDAAMGTYAISFGGASTTLAVKHENGDWLAKSPA